jgi:peptide/nickel transport system substrate-binding protein
MAGGVETFHDSFSRMPLGTGPFTVSNWVAGERIVLQRNDHFWGTPPALDWIAYHIVHDTDSLLTSLRTGEVQMVGGAGAIPANRVDDALAMPGIVVFEHPTQNWQHLDLKQMDFLRETPVRQALDLATPKERIIAEVLAGRALPAAADQAPGSWAYNPGVQPRPFDPGQAAALLDGVGLAVRGDGVRTRDGKRFAVELWGIANDPLAARIIELIAAEWNRLGVATTPRFGHPATIWGPMGYQFSDNMTASLYTWTNFNDPDDLFYWHSSQIPTSPTASGGNLPAFFHPYGFQEEIDALTAEAAATLDREGRRQLYWQIQELLAREAPVIFLYWEQAFPLVATNVGGFWPSAFNQLLWNASDWYLVDPTRTEPDATPGATPIASPVSATTG